MVGLTVTFQFCHFNSCPHTENPDLGEVRSLETSLTTKRPLVPEECQEDLLGFFSL